MAAFKAGYNFGETTELFAQSYSVRPAPAEPGLYRNIAGSTALAWGLVAASKRSGVPLFYASYPITPASELLHELSRLKNFGVVTLQAEDEIAAANIALGASFAGQLGVTGTSGPGMDLKAETLGLAVIMELPMVIVDVQRAGPPRACRRRRRRRTCLLAMYGRHGSRPCRSSPRAPGALLRRRHRGGPHRRDLQDARDPPVRYVPRELLRAVADPRPRLAADLRARLRHRPEPRRRVPAVSEGRAPRAAVGDPRDRGARAPDRRPRAENVTGDISYDPENHETMTRIRQRKIDRMAEDLPPLEVEGDADADTLVLGWGSTAGTIRAAARRVRAQGHGVATAHLVHLNPLPSNLGEILRGYRKVLIPEMNTGQLSLIVRSRFLVDAVGYNKVQGLPIFAEELEQEILRVLDA